MTSTSSPGDFTVGGSLYLPGPPETIYLGGIDIYTLFGGGGAPTNAEYITWAANATLSNERVLQGTAGQIVATNSPPNMTLSLADAGPGAAVYTTVKDLTLDAKGRVTALTQYSTPFQTQLSNGSGGEPLLVGSVIRNMGSSAELTVVNPGGAAPLTYNLAASGVTPGTYTNATVQVDSKGRVVSASSGAGGGGGAPVSASYVVVSADPTLTQERTLQIKPFELSLVDNGPNNSVQVGLFQIFPSQQDGINPTYISVDIYGRIVDVGPASGAIYNGDEIVITGISTAAVPPDVITPLLTTSMGIPDFHPALSVSNGIGAIVLSGFNNVYYIVISRSGYYRFSYGGLLSDNVGGQMAMRVTTAPGPPPAPGTDLLISPALPNIDNSFTRYASVSAGSYLTVIAYSANAFLPVSFLWPRLSVELVHYM